MTDTILDEAPVDIGAPDQVVATRGARSPIDAGRHRFMIAVGIGLAVVAIPVLWVSWSLWTGTVDPLRRLNPAGYYDLQGRAMLSGHLWVPPGSLSIEGFLHGGHTFTYFGVLPSILRLPILAVTTRFDGRMTSPSILVGWALTGMFTSLLLWRARIMIRGDQEMGLAEAASYGALIATICGGSVIVFLAASPWVYFEDFTWSIALCTGVLFALLGLVERPSRGRVWACGALILAASLNRTTTGYACVIGALLVAGWFALGRGGDRNRRWALPVAISGLLGLLANAAVTYAKFGSPVGVPMASQVWTQVNAHRRYFLAANGGKGFSLRFLPSTLTAYLQPAGMRISSLFPYLSLPPTPAQPVGPVVLDQTYRTGSIPATMPLLFLLSCWGMISAFRPRAQAPLGAIRLLLIAAGAASVGVLVWGYISQQYLGDFMPFLIIASGIGMIDIWRRLHGKSTRARAIALGAITILAVFGIAANVAIAGQPDLSGNNQQATAFTRFQLSVSHGALAGVTTRGSSIPYFAPAGELRIIGDCTGLYRSRGENLANVPGQQIEHQNWQPIEQGPGINNVIDVRFHLRNGTFDHAVPLVTFGASTLVVQPWGHGYARMQIITPGSSNVTWPPAIGWPFRVRSKTYRFSVMTDPHLNAIEVGRHRNSLLAHYLPGTGPAVVQSTHLAPGEALPEVVVQRVPTRPSDMSICRTLEASH